MLVMCHDGSYFFYNEDGSPTEATVRATKALEDVMAVSRHPFAEHLYIHITEGSTTPERALEAAARLQKDAKTFEEGHLQHMPGHTYIRTGHFADAVETNVHAVASDLLFIDNGLYPYGP